MAFHPAVHGGGSRWQAEPRITDKINSIGVGEVIRDFADWVEDLSTKPQRLNSEATRDRETRNRSNYSAYFGYVNCVLP